MLTLHVGLHKTGSTSIQSALRVSTHRPHLRIWVPGMAGDPLDSGTAQSLVAAAEQRHVVVSSEDLLGDCVDGYAHASLRAGRLKHLYGTADPRVVVYLRRQTDWLPSVYLQTIQEGRDLSPEDFWSRIEGAPHLTWMNLLGALTEHFPRERLIVQVQDPARDVVDDFFAVSQLGISPASISAPIRENVSISATQAPLFRMVCRSGPLSRDELRLVRNFFQGGSTIFRSPRISPFPTSIQNEIINRFADDWAAVSTWVDEARHPGKLTPAARAPWPSRPLTFAGSSLDDKAIQAEAIQALRASILQIPAARDPTLISRLAFKVRRNPRDVPAAFRRAVLRRTRAET